MADAGKIVITPKGAYSSTKTYEWLDEVSYNGNAYVALKTVTGVTPSDDGVNWRLFMSSADVDANVLVPKFTEASTRSNIVSGENLSTMFGKIKKWFTDLKSHAFKDLVNNLTTSTTGSALDASQGKVLQDEVDGVNRNLGNNASTNVWNNKRLYNISNYAASSAGPDYVETDIICKPNTTYHWTCSYSSIITNEWVYLKGTSQVWLNHDTIHSTSANVTSGDDGIIKLVLTKEHFTDWFNALQNASLTLGENSEQTEYRGDSNIILTEEVDNINESLYKTGIYESSLTGDGSSDIIKTIFTNNFNKDIEVKIVGNTSATDKQYAFFALLLDDEETGDSWSNNEFEKILTVPTGNKFGILCQRNASVNFKVYSDFALGSEVATIKNDLSTHTHNYAGSDTPGGSATYALQANKDGAGNVIDATYINKTYMRNYGAGSIAFGNNIFIGIFNGDIICSSDGQEWEVNFEPNLFSLLDNDEILLGITYGNEKFVSFSNKGCSYVSSDNGNTWTKTQTIITV